MMQRSWPFSSSLAVCLQTKIQCVGDWLPMLLLCSERFKLSYCSHLVGMFGQRPNPEAARLADAAFAEEDRLGSKLEALVAQNFLQVNITAAMFDSFILAAPSGDLYQSGLQDCFADFANATGTKAVFKPWASLA